MSDHSDTETSSIGSKSSQVSATHQQIACPYCSWAKKQRYLFKHIINNHYEELYTAVGTAEQIKNDLEDENLLRLNISVYSPDDEFKEFDKTPKPIYGCLGCLNTYEQPGRAKAHWKNSKKCHQTHIKKVKAELKKVKEFESKKGDSWINELSEKDFAFMIEKYRRYYYRLMVEDIPFLSSQPYNKGLEIAPRFLDYEFKEPKEFKNRERMMEAFKSYGSFLHSLNIHISKKFMFPYEWRLPNPFDLSEPYEEAGLLPVGSSYEEYGKKRLADAQKKKIDEEAQEILFKKRLEEEKKKFMEEMKKLDEEEKSKPKEEKPVLETIKEEPAPKKEKRNSFTIPRSDLTSMMTTTTQPFSFPTLVSDTKVKRQPKTVAL